MRRSNSKFFSSMKSIDFVSRQVKELEKLGHFLFLFYRRGRGIINDLYPLVSKTYHPYTRCFHEKTFYFDSIGSIFYVQKKPIVFSISRQIDSQIVTTVTR